MYWTGARRGVAGHCCHVTELLFAPGDYFYFCADPVPVASGSLHCEFKPMISPRAVIHPYFGRCAERGYNNVKFAIVVKISNRRSAMAAGRLRSEPGGGG